MAGWRFSELLLATHRTRPQATSTAVGVLLPYCEGTERPWTESCASAMCVRHVLTLPCIS
eukprot:CAMPEP_0117694072 /NCGR_PEP_ID=MMETSP0804-20121206/27238_1 /TAXON_ID=1074897 /ORGANISM="Tetraselmis astigmatica, Strain CCMP880" /LENGTH=59 /DNA_ID=CAMNT_0005507707 /DNA_START=138 /DNA_END=313 /DNA_ORIENTATION=+